MNLRQRHPRALVGLLAVTVAVLSIGACTSDDDSGIPVELRFADYVGPQQRQVSTNLILPDRERDGDRLGFGWAVKEPKDLDETILEMRRATARIRFFSSDADARNLEIEAYWSGSPAKAAPAIALLLNGHHVADLHVGDDWDSYRVDIPVGTVRQGVNVLELQRGADSARPRRKRRFPRYLRVRHFRIHTPDGRPHSPERPAKITLRAGSPGESGKPIIQMPANSYLDLVAELPRRSRLVGHYTIEFPSEGAREAATLYVELLDGQGKTRELMVKNLRRPTEKPSRLVVDLDRWSGELVRLRLGVRGVGDALVQWHDPRVLGRGEAGTQATQGREAAIAPARSGLLGRPDVVFILLDTARADAFSCFGGTYPTATLDRLAQEGTKFNRALAPSSWTGQSVPAIFTGLFPDTVGIQHWGSRLPAGVPTLAGLLQETGYSTRLWSQHPFYRWHKDLKTGFQEVHLQKSRVIDSEELKPWLADNPQPAFAFVHLLPPHLPYEPPEPYRGLLTSSYQGEIPVTADFLNQFPHRRSPEEFDSEDLRYISDRYLEHAVFADSQVAEVLNILEELGRYDDALIVVLADHGEGFLEHGFFLHGQNLYDEFLHVPLLIKWPQSVDGFSSSIDQPVSLVDLVPTLVDGLDLPSDRGFQGISLLPAVFGEAELRRPLYSTTRGSDQGSQSPNTSSMLLLDGWKIIQNRITLETQLYNLNDDADEKHDLAGEMPVQTQYLLQEIQRRIWLNEGFLESGGGEIDPETLDQEEIEQLKALGYLN